MFTRHENSKVTPNMRVFGVSFVFFMEELEFIFTSTEHTDVKLSF